MSSSRAMFYALLVAVLIGSTYASPIETFVRSTKQNRKGPEETAEPSPSPEEPSPSPTPICFPASGEVTMEDGSSKTMENLQLGDRVLVGKGVFSEVFMFTHKLSDVVNNFVTLKTASGSSISLTHGHYMYLNGALAAASTAKVGDTVELANGDKTSVTEVSITKQRGLYNPQTVHGDVIVDGIRASTYTTAIDPKIAHALLTPMRVVFNRLGFTTSMLDAGSDLAAKFIPSGQATAAM